jgi:hypothetical protein
MMSLLAEYQHCIPAENSCELQKAVDYQNDGVDEHLGELADVLEKWEEIAPWLGLTSIEIDDIKKENDREASKRSVWVLL